MVVLKRLQGKSEKGPWPGSDLAGGAQDAKEFLEEGGGDFRANIELKTINRWDVGSVESSDTYASCNTQPFASQADLSDCSGLYVNPMGSETQARRPRFLQGIRTKARFDPVDAARVLQPDTIQLPRPPEAAPPPAQRASPFAKVLTLFAASPKNGVQAKGESSRPETRSKSILKKGGSEERQTTSTGTATTPSLGALCVQTVDVMCSPVQCGPAAERTPLLSAEDSPEDETHALLGQPPTDVS